MRYAMVIDTKKCVGCSDCVVACQTENNVPIGYCRDWITERVEGAYPNLELELRSERCNHCENAPCVRCCPTGASHIIEGGIVLVTPDECIGCGACIESCPYDARYNIRKAMWISVRFAIIGSRKANSQPVFRFVLPNACILAIWITLTVKCRNYSKPESIKPWRQRRELNPMFII